MSVDAPADPATLPPLWGGTDIPIIGLTGPKASGKTLFASTIDPAHTLMIDCEMSSASYANIPYKLRVDLFEELAKQKLEPTSLNAWKVVKKFIEETRGIRVACIDPWDFVQQGYVDWIESQPEKFGRSKAQYEKASGLLWGDVKSSLHMWLGMQARRIGGSIVLINHLGKVWKDGKPTDKEKTKGVDTIYQLASLYIKFDRSPDGTGKVPAAPAGYTVEVKGGKSRLVNTVILPNGDIELKPILPARIENCTPAKIREYIAKPANFEKPKKSELIEEEVLSEDEKLIMQKEIVTTQLEVETAKLSQMEILKLNAERQADLRKRQAEAAEKATTTTTTATTFTQAAIKEAEKVSEAAVNSMAQSAKPKEKANDPPRESSKPSPDSDPTIYEIVAAQKIDLGIKDSDWQAVLTKRGVKKLEELSLEQAEEIRKALWTKITKRDAEAALKKGKDPVPY